MALTTRPKPKSHHKKRQARHHRLSKHYMKAYLPYLPVLAIVGLGVLVNKFWTASDAAQASAGPVLGSTRLGLVTGNTSNRLFFIVLAITFVAFSLFVLFHWYRFRRVVNRGEKFVVEHPWADIGLIFIVTVGVVLTRS